MGLKKEILVIGYGDVGKAIVDIEREAGNVCEINDKARASNPLNDKRFDVVHICYPYNETFIFNTIKHISYYKSELYIIHSTVRVGTTENLAFTTSCNIAHSPVRGLHGEIFSGLKTFIKYIGGRRYAAKGAAEHLESLGIKTEILGNAMTTELLKLLSTAYYGWNILFAKEANRLCAAYGLSFNKVYTEANRTYNEGYAVLGMNHVIRPTLKPLDGKIGGTCVSQNVELLDESVFKRCFKEINES